MSSRLLQQWIKPTQEKEPEAKKVDKTQSKQLWNNIFKPAKEIRKNEKANDDISTLSSSESIEIPKFMYTFKADPEKLNELKSPKVHTFFSKRNTTIVKATSGKFVKQIEQHAPFNVYHIRSPRTWAHRKVPRRIINLRNYGYSTENYSSQLVSNDVYIPPAHIHPSRRTLQTKKQLITLCELNGCSNFSEIVTPKSMFDLGEFETQMWCHKYQPKCWKQHINSKKTQEIVNWLKEQFEVRPRVLQHTLNHAKKRRPLSQAFVVDDDYEETMEMTSDVLVVSGVTGVGKTSAVYSACNSLNAFVFEVNTSMKRTGKELSSILDGISMNHAVHKADNVVILIDDADVVFENECGTFWPTIQRFATSSKRPIIITCTDPSLLALGSVRTESIHFSIPNGVKVMDLAWSISLSEGHSLEKSKVAHLVVKYKADIRKVLTELQFWCQMGIGGHPSGIDWVPRECERDFKIVSETWLPFSATNKNQDESIDKELLSHEEMIHHEILKHGQSIHSRPPPEEMINISNAITLNCWSEPIIIGAKTPVYAVPHSYVDINIQSEALCNDVLPYIRQMACIDHHRASNIQNILIHHTVREGRMLQRTWNSQGYDVRNHLNLPIKNLEQIKTQCFPNIDYAVPKVKFPEWFSK